MSGSTIHNKQLEKFKEAARELESDEDELRWDDRLRKVAKAKPQKDGESERD